MNKKLVDALEICLQALERGETISAALQRFPQMADDLRPLLEMAQKSRSSINLPVPQDAQTRGRARVQSAATQLRTARVPRPQRRRFWTVSFATLAVVAFIALTGNGLLIASANSLPGDILYL